MRRAIGLLRGLIPIAVAVIAGIALAQPANVSDAEDVTPVIHPVGRALDVIAIPVETPVAATAVELAYKDAPAAPKATAPTPPKATAPAPAKSAPAPKSPSQPAAPAAPPSNDKGSFSITCYAIKGGTSSGQPTGPGVAAADGAYFPLGTKIHIDGIGDYTVLDRGPHGRVVDIWMSSYNDCLAFGRKTRNVSVVS